MMPLKQSVEVYTPGEVEYDRFGNEVRGAGQWVEVSVAQWWVHRTEEKGDDSILRLVDLLTLHCPPESAPGADGRVRLSDGSEWEVDGRPEDFTHGWHGWSPGLLVVNCRRVTG